MHSNQCSLTLESNGNGFEALIIPKNTFLIESILSAQSTFHDMGWTHENSHRKEKSLYVDFLWANHSHDLTVLPA